MLASSPAPRWKYQQQKYNKGETINMKKSSDTCEVPGGKTSEFSAPLARRRPLSTQILPPQVHQPSRQSGSVVE